jgi:2-(1,2-epoxy-1,2-dihydrophenyl)acetyl-CoA isomerase
MADQIASIARSPGDLIEDRDGQVVILTLNRPDRLNALTPELVDDLCATLQRLRHQPDVRAVVLTGSGRAFCSGADLKSGGGDAEAILRAHYNPLVATMAELELPLIAAVNGVAAGAGASLAFACDLRVAARSARFQLSFVKVGLIPDAGATWTLPRLVGTSRALELALLARDLEAPEALEWGLVNRIADDGAALAHALELAYRLAGLPSSVGLTKLALYGGLGRGLSSQLAYEAGLQGQAQAGSDFEEARRAFVEKRAPRFGAA